MAAAFGLIFDARVDCRGGIALAVAAAAPSRRTLPTRDPASVEHAPSRCSLPQNPQVFGTAMPSVVKATAIVNGDVITQTDIDQRLRLLAIANGGRNPGGGGRAPAPAGAAQPDRRDARRSRPPRAEKITIKPSDIDKTVARVAGNVKQTPEQLDRLSRIATARSIRSMRRQIEGEIAWQRLQRAKIESGISVGDDEVKAVLDRMNASKGAEEYHVGEIFLSATPGDRERRPRQCQQDPRAAAQRRVLRRLCPAIFGSLDCRGRRRPRLGPSRAAPGAARRRRCARWLPGTVSNPIPVPGGVSILAVQDTRKILTADPRDAVLSLKQVSISFPKGTTRAGGGADRRAASPRRRGRSAAAAARKRSRPTSMAKSSRAIR